MVNRFQVLLRKFQYFALPHSGGSKPHALSRAGEFAIVEGVLPDSKGPPLSTLYRRGLLKTPACHTLEISSERGAGVRLDPNDSTTRLLRIPFAFLKSLHQLATHFP